MKITIEVPDGFQFGKLIFVEALEERGLSLTAQNVVLDTVPVMLEGQDTVLCQRFLQQSLNK